MKKFLIILLALIIVFVPVAVIAQPRYEAEFSFQVKINGKSISSDYEKIYVYKNDKVDISFDIKTNEDYFAGPFSTEIFIPEDVLSFEDFTWNTSGRFYSCCKTYSNLKLNSDVDQYLKLDMIPTSADCKAAPSSLDESVVNLSFIAIGDGKSQGRVYIDENNIRSNKNPFGSMYLACFTDDGNLNGKRYDYGNETSFDLTGADVNFIVTNLCDINMDNVVNGADALLMIQFATDLKSANEEQFENADVNSDGRINASDSLVALQLATDLVNINDILNK